MSYTERAEALLHEWVQSESLRKHCYAVAASMRHFATRMGGAPDLWGAVGLLHDLDFEQYPAMPGSGPEITAISEALTGDGPVPAQLPGHPFYGVARLRELGWPAEVRRAILSHADYSGIPRVTPMEKTLAAVDELSSFVVACALVKPSRSVDEVDVRSVRKKMKDKAFARAVSREEIAHNAEALGLPLDEVIAGVIAALQQDAVRLGVAGTAT
ncbi:MAG TPA: HAD family hydrolase [Roseiflexaceae bacterium]|nr:HAD family hydrolase [Roseiflexaceae bacterium]